MMKKGEFAQIILNQIQAIDRWALGSWGASDFYFDEKEKSLSFKVRMNHRNAKIIIKLNGMDLYDITYGRVTRNNEWVIINEKKDIYSEQLVSVIDNILKK